MARILILNPNSSTKVTGSITHCLDILKESTSHIFEFDLLKDAPLSIESDQDVAKVAPMVTDRAVSSDMDALVVACFSDPGVEETRQALPHIPVIGIAEAAYYAALQLGRRFGVVSLSPASVARHSLHLDKLGIRGRLAQDRAVSLSVEESGDPGRSRDKVIAAARTLAETDHAQSIILGCAGMGAQRSFLQHQIGLPVIDPVQAGVASAITSLDLDYFAKD